MSGPGIPEIVVNVRFRYVSNCDTVFPGILVEVGPIFKSVLFNKEGNMVHLREEYVE